MWCGFCLSLWQTSFSTSFLGYNKLVSDSGHWYMLLLLPRRLLLHGLCVYLFCFLCFLLIFIGWFHLIILVSVSSSLSQDAFIVHFSKVVSLKTSILPYPPTLSKYPIWFFYTVCYYSNLLIFCHSKPPLEDKLHAV